MVFRLWRMPQLFSHALLLQGATLLVTLWCRPSSCLSVRGTFTFLCISGCFTPNFFTLKIFLQWAVGEARRDTMLPSILVFCFVLVARNYSTPPISGISFVSLQRNCFILGVVHDTKWCLVLLRCTKHKKTSTCSKQKEKARNLASQAEGLLELCSLFWFGEPNGRHTTGLFFQAEGPRAQQWWVWLRT